MDYATDNSNTCFRRAILEDEQVNIGALQWGRTRAGPNFDQWNNVRDQSRTVAIHKVLDSLFKATVAEKHKFGTPPGQAPITVLYDCESPVAQFVAGAIFSSPPDIDGSGHENGLISR
ncbi:MAG TPA: hypothetical protein VJQ50_18165 [Terriglobales bacterium]|nr:hypothetical protein [Terriglobales bacterium]